MRAHRIATAAAGGALGLLAATPLVAWASSAPPGSASGSVLTVGSPSSPIVAVSSTSANASSNHDGSSATVLNVAGMPISTGSSADGSSPESGSLLGTGSSAPADVEVAPYSASSSTPTAGSSSSEGKASVATVTLGSVALGVGQSDSKASYTTAPDGSTSSQGSTTTDGVILNAPGLYVDLLHADANSNGKGSSYLVGINGTQIPPSSALQGVCNNLNIPSLLALNCVSATGGVGNLFEDVAQAQVPSGTGGLPVTAFGAGGIGGGVGTASTGAAVSGSGNSAPAPLGSAPAGPGTASSGTGSGNLPFTGAPIALWVLGSAALLGLGAVTVKTSSLVAPQLFG